MTPDDIRHSCARRLFGCSSDKCSCLCHSPEAGAMLCTMMRVAISRFHHFPLVSRAFGGQLRGVATAAPGGWQVSSHGRLLNPFGIISFGSAHQSGYFRVRMRGEPLLVHRVVASSFFGPPPSEDAWEVHHKDGNPGNNHISNLEYVTRSENVCHSFASGTRRCGGYLLSKPVRYRAVGAKDWTRCSSITAAALKLGVSRCAVSRACWQETPLKGYEMRFADLHQPELPGEEWRQMMRPTFGKEVPGRTVSSLGRLRTQAGRIHSGCLRSGHPAARYTSCSGSRLESVHRRVAVAFLGPPPSSECSHVNHKDGDRQNNAAANLEYVTPAENRSHYLENRAVQREGKCQTSARPVWSRACNSNDEWTWHPSMLSAAKVLGIHHSSVSRCVHGKCRQGGGHEFQAADAFQTLPGEEWREVDVSALVEEKKKRVQGSKPRA